MTVEEIEIIVTAKVEESLKEFKKISPTIKQSIQQAQDDFSKVDTKAITSKLHQAINFMKKKMQDLKKSSEDSKIAIKVNNKDAQKQITQIQKQIDNLQEKINARQIKLNVINPQIDKIVDDTRKSVTPDGINPNSKAMDTTVNNALNSNKNFTSLNSQAQKLYTEIEMYNKQLEQAKNKMTQLEQEINKTITTQNKLGSFFSAFKQKIEQAKPSITKLKEGFKQILPIGRKITGIFKGYQNNKAGDGFKNRIKNVLKYAGALLSLRSIYSVLSSSVQAWLGSQNAQAKQLRANIDYMKYAMGSALAPVIQFITNLVYQLMKAIQSVVYAMFGVNIFAKATASSMNKTAGSASKASKSLAGVHSEINNISDNNGGSGTTSPSIDLSNMDNTPNSIIDAIKQGDWNSVGVLIGEKINESMSKIPWKEIQSTAKDIGTNIADFLNGGIKSIDWNQVGDTLAQGLNTISYLTLSFFKGFDFTELGRSIGDSINGFINNTDWGALASNLAERIKGIFDTVTGFAETFDWSSVFSGIIDYITGFDWNGVSDAIFNALGAACASLVNLGMVIGQYIKDAFTNIGQYFQDKIEECGGNVVLGILKGIGDAVISIGQWIYEHVFKPFIDGFKNVFGIHSPSTVMAEQGKFIIQGLLNGISSLVNNIKQIWEIIKNTAVEKFTDIKNSISNIWQQVTNKTSEVWQNIKNKVKEGAQGAWNGITSIFSNIPNWFRDKFSQAWQAVKNVFSSGGQIFDGIKNGILDGLKSVINAIITGINKVISLPFNGLNSALRKIRDVNIMGLSPFSWISTIQVPQIPRLAKGNVAYDETLAIFGEYSGASNNPEITTPQSIMRETFEDVLSNYSNENSDRPINLTVNVGNTKLGQILLDHLRDMKRQSGKDIEALVGG